MQVKRRKLQKFYTDYKGELRSGNIELFLQISIDIYLEILNIKTRIDILHEKLNPKDIPDPKKFVVERVQFYDEIGFLNKKNYKLAIQGIITLSTYYEALINEIGVVELGSKYYKENLDKLSVQAKWEIILRLIYSKGIDKNSQEYESLNEIITLRNKLVHYKTKTLGKPSKENIQQENENARKIMIIFETGIVCLKKFHLNLRNIDSSKEILKFFKFSRELERF